MAAIWFLLKSDWYVIFKNYKCVESKNYIGKKQCTIPEFKILSFSSKDIPRLW